MGLSQMSPYLPVHEADRIHHSRLHYLPAWEDSPRHSIGLHVMGVCCVLTLNRKYMYMCQNVSQIQQ